MPLRIFRCQICGNEKKTLKQETPHCLLHPDVRMVEVLTAPEQKMMETIDKNMGKSKVKGLTKMLKERSRNYARDKEADDLINFNRANGIERSGFLDKNGKKRNKISDK